MNSKETVFVMDAYYFNTKKMAGKITVTQDGFLFDNKQTFLVPKKRMPEGLPVKEVTLEEALRIKAEQRQSVIEGRKEWYKQHGIAT